jgi:hypothetical protein
MRMMFGIYDVHVRHGTYAGGTNTWSFASSDRRSTSLWCDQKLEALNIDLSPCPSFLSAGQWPGTAYCAPRVCDHFRLPEGIAAAMP